MVSNSTNCLKKMLVLAIVFSRACDKSAKKCHLHVALGGEGWTRDLGPGGLSEETWPFPEAARVAEERHVHDQERSEPGGA